MTTPTRWDAARAKKKGQFGARMPSCRRCGQPSLYDPCRTCATPTENAERPTLPEARS